MAKCCPYNYVRVNRQLENYDCSEDCVAVQETQQLQAEIAEIKTAISRIYRFQYVGMFQSARRHTKKLAEKINICKQCSGRGEWYKPTGYSHAQRDEAITLSDCEQCKTKGWNAAMKRAGDVLKG